MSLQYLQISTQHFLPSIWKFYLLVCRAALRQPNQVLFDYRVQRTLEITALPFNSVLADRLPHRRPRYWRDKTFGAGFVMPLNIFLGWLLVSADLVNLQL